ncbi:DUF1236 domain-containing protein [Microvirga calopogonii]|uniref:DUF1236 domain-containing protein n=1 Tax=Microvirga calopogonii TaxID=2078013 RepID=UPI0013B37671|nr:DUF1236 domain-containing protein [Microvirga calopogonii]
MRAAYHLALAVFSVGAVTAPTAAPNATDPVAASLFEADFIPGVVRNVAAEVSARLAVNQDSSAGVQVEKQISVGESLSDSVELHPIPKHETYRYGVVDGHRIIVDATSRKVVYVIQ